MVKPPEAATHSGSRKINNLILSSIENQEREIIEIIPRNSKEHRYQSERLRNILRLRGYSKRLIASAFEGRDLALTSTGLALVPREGITDVMVIGEGFVLATSLGGEP
ncbi:MAG: hypothetical protein RM368_36565 [Nostoc sp. DedSLP03]|uniref:hypothetical protein n=1 Tax=Nostoc sp. DedSLP03 TaxID=3075400 RepID=UPI002AD2763B|nr:hypothetical protein [Nostoc sp. DedSLP03]MDZ7970384.1 hypothetical protein [Nostoc sp. DedSLP03]